MDPNKKNVFGGGGGGGKWRGGARVNEYLLLRIHVLKKCGWGEGKWVGAGLE